MISLGFSGQGKVFGVISDLGEFLAEEGFESSEYVDALVVVEPTNFVGGEEFSFLSGLLYAVAAVNAFVFCCVSYPNCLAAEHVTNPFGGGLVVAAEEELAVTVGCDCFPVVFV